MKKFNVLTTVLLCASVMFVGCSEKEVNDINGSQVNCGPGNGGSGVVVKPKKVSQVIETTIWESDGNTSSSKDTIIYEYNAEGQLSKITEFTRGAELISNITYASDKITIKNTITSSTEDSSLMVIELKDNRAIKMKAEAREVDGSNIYQYNREVTYSYSGNYVSKMIDINTESINGELTYDWN